MPLSRFLKVVFALCILAVIGNAKADIYTTANIVNDGYILRTDDSGFTSVFSTDATPYFNISGIAFNSTNTMYVADADGLYTVNTLGARTQIASVDTIYQTGIAIDNQDDVYVADFNLHILKYASTGTLLATWDAFDSTEAMVYNGGRLYVTNYSDNSIGYYDTTTGDYTPYVSLGDGFFPTGLARDAAGNFYVTSDADPYQIVKVDPSLNITSYVTTGLSGPWGLEWTDNGLLIANQWCGCVGQTNSILLADGLGGVTLISDLGDDYTPVFLVTAPVPEPSTFALFLSAGAMGFVMLRRRKASLR
ncbi:MAG: PEP-CTERM sorting domain-containing protein [Chthoniobacterales bacterium]